MDPVLAIDFGTSNSAAAVLMPDGAVLVLVDSTSPKAEAVNSRTKAFPTFAQYDDEGSRLRLAPLPRRRQRPFRIWSSTA